MRTVPDRQRSALPRVALQAACLCGWLVGCGWLWIGATGGAGLRCEGSLRPIDELGTDFSIRQELYASAGARRGQLVLVLQKHAGRVVLVGLHPLGDKLFQAVQTGTRAEVEIFRGGSPLHPLTLLQVLERVHFAGTPAPAGALEIERRDGLIWLRDPTCGYEATLRVLSDSRFK